MTAPIPVRVTRYGCPHCGRTASRPVRTREHMARCWYNPAARSCKTCKHFGQDFGDADTGYSDVGEYCEAGVSLAGRPECGKCDGTGDTSGGLGIGVCPACSGDAKAIKAGPIVHCDLWEPQESAAQTGSDQGLTVTASKLSGGGS